MKISKSEVFNRTEIFTALMFRTELWTWITDKSGNRPRPNSVTFNAEPECCLLDDESCEDMVELKPTRRRRAKKPNQTLRDAIKESIRTSETEQDESKLASDGAKTENDKKTIKKKCMKKVRRKNWER